MTSPGGFASPQAGPFPPCARGVDALTESSAWYLNSALPPFLLLSSFLFFSPDSLQDNSPLFSFFFLLFVCLCCIMAASALLRNRVKRPSYLGKLAKPEDLIDLFPNGSYIGWSGFTGVGYPKYVFLVLIHPVS